MADHPLRPTPAADAAATVSGLSPRAAACLAYAMWWVSGALMLAIEPTNAYVRFHARQAVRVFGVIWLAGVGCWGLSFVLVFLSPLGFRAAAILGQVTWVVGVLVWVLCLSRAWAGQRWLVPWLGPRLRVDR